MCPTESVSLSTAHYIQVKMITDIVYFQLMQILI